MWWTAVATRPGEAKKKEHHKYLMYLSAALLSAKANAPSLEPHLIYSGEPGGAGHACHCHCQHRRSQPSVERLPACDAGPVAPWFLAWWKQQGGKLHEHELSFMGELKRLVASKEKNEGWLDNYGAFLRLDLHLLVNRSSVPAGVEDEMVLYTDADVLFLKVKSRRPRSAQCTAACGRFRSAQPLQPTAPDQHACLPACLPAWLARRTSRAAA
jgi:hypothetical protein